MKSTRLSDNKLGWLLCTPALIAMISCNRLSHLLCLLAQSVSL